MAEWYNKKYTRSHLHSSYDFRRKKYKGLLIFIGIILFLFIIYSYNLFGIKTNINNLNFTNLTFGLKNVGINFISIKDLNQNPNNYLGKTVNINGMLNNRLGGYSLEDSDGYWVWIGNNELGEGCIEHQREYNYNSQFYTVRGVWTAPKECDDFFCISFKDEWHLECSSHLA